MTDRGMPIDRAMIAPHKRKWTRSKLLNHICFRKIRYACHDDAETAIGEIARRDNEYALRLSSYSCVHCDGFHIGQTPKRFRKSQQAATALAPTDRQQQPTEEN
jgi:hypothetical protein